MAMSITPENERVLADAVKSGRFNTQEEALAEALRLLSASSNGSSICNDPLPPDDWVREFDQITQSRTVSVPDVDDSRESIYGDRGV